MQFTTEALQTVVQILWHDLEHQTAFQGLDAREQEQALQQGLQQVGAALLQRAWEAHDAQIHARGVRCEVPDCPEQGWRMRRTARRSVHVLTQFGPVRYRRSEYQGRCGHRRQPLDETFGLQPGQPSPWLEGLLAELGAQQPFEQGATWLARWWGVKVSPNTVRRATGAWGARLAQEETHRFTASGEAESPRPAGPPRVYGAIDGGFVLLRQDAHDPERWREAKMVAWFQEGRPYHAPKPGEDGPPKRARDIQYAGTLKAKEAFGQVLWSSAVAYQADRAAEVVILADGAAWIWDLVRTYFPQAVEILDWTHAHQRLHTVRKAQWGEEDLEAGMAWLIPVRQALWEGEVDTVVAACQALAAQGGPGAEEARKAAGYFEQHRRRMRYDAFRKAGYFIGSGVIESGVKQVITARLKVAGAQWNPSSGETMLKARCALLNAYRSPPSPLAV